MWPIRPAKLLVFATGCLPLAWLVWRALEQDLGADPQKTLVHQTGLWALRWLLVTLSLSPAARLMRRPWLLQFRRMLGLFAFAYASVHLLLYYLLLLFGDLGNLLDDLIKRPYATVGFVAWLILLALAVTSPRFMVRRLGKRWKPLHRWVYGALALALVHFAWQSKLDMTEPLVYAAIALAILAITPLHRRLRRYRMSEA
jgi:sulfoxide reductase heme-binding subunit YedZ